MTSRERPATNTARCRTEGRMVKEYPYQGWVNAATVILWAVTFSLPQWSYWRGVAFGAAVAFGVVSMFRLVVGK